MFFKIITLLAVCFWGTSQVSSFSFCGLRNPFSRIVGGTAAKHGAWPWQMELLIVQKDGTTYTHRCGGTLIDHQWVVTAAHCVFMIPDPSHYKVVLGQINRTEVTGSSQLKYVYDVSCIKIHEEYMIPKNGYGYDVALLKLARPAIFRAGKIWPACLPRQGQRVAIGTECFITGWGKSSFNSTFSDVLQQAKMPVVDYSTCAAGNVNLSYASIDDKTMLCAGYGGNSAVSGCHGDSGGPFVCQESGRWFLRGAVSWGDHKCKAGSIYSVFARISTFVKWIHDTKRNPHCGPVKPIDSTCKDNLAYCKNFFSNGYCKNGWYAEYLKLNCPLSCNHCTQGSKKTTTQGGLQ